MALDRTFGEEYDFRKHQIGRLIQHDDNIYI